VGLREYFIKQKQKRRHKSVSFYLTNSLVILLNLYDFGLITIKGEKEGILQEKVSLKFLLKFHSIYDPNFSRINEHLAYSIGDGAYH